MKKAGIIITLVGIALIIFTSFTSIKIEKSIGIKPIERSINSPGELNWYPLIGVGILGIGAIIIKIAAEKR